MENGMGMLTGEPGAPTSEDYGPSLGRGMGFGSTNDFARSNGPVSEQNARQNMGPMQMQEGDIAPDADQIPGFPQDAYMEGSMMAMDQMVAKPENNGLRPGWSGFMQGMMTLLRVLPPDKYDEIMRQVKSRRKPETPGMDNMSGMEHPHQ